MHNLLFAYFLMNIEEKFSEQYYEDLVESLTPSKPQTSPFNPWRYVWEVKFNLLLYIYIPSWRRQLILLSKTANLFI